MAETRATLPVVEMVKENNRRATRAYVLWNMVKPGTKISRELQGMVRMQVLKNSIAERIGFTYSTMQG